VIWRYFLEETIKVKIGFEIKPPLILLQNHKNCKSGVAQVCLCVLGVSVKQSTNYVNIPKPTKEFLFLENSV
jgi:hypothetical protein